MSPRATTRRQRRGTTCPMSFAIAPTTVIDMFAADSGTNTALVVVLVLCAVAFAALVLVLYRVLVALADLRSDLELIEAEMLPMVNELRDAARETRDIIDAARGDLKRFDKVLGSAESISEAVADTSRVARTVLSAPVIKVAAAATGTRRAFSVLRRRR
ncbi:MAG: DUF948 domain-containing protein [Actinobacteria bacterium]|nr:DUF948 domain-containing protein [Actinomycetota bacterium]NBP53020.1 DUF948 domain-containing protein [Actinomycetota bacterium]